jgi:hypothetical protein
MFKTVSQTNVSYRGSALSTGSAGRVQGGDRLPWVRFENGSDNFASLHSLAWQAHVYGEASPQVEQACARSSLELRRFPWGEAAGKAGLARDAFYLVRPDAYVGLIATTDIAGALKEYQTRLGLVFASGMAP